MRAVTAPEVGVTVAFHADVTVCPDGSVKPRVQPLTAVVPALVIVTAVVSPVFQAFTVYDTWQPPTGTDGEPDGEPDGDLDGDADGEDGCELEGVGLVPPDNPKNAMTIAACPAMGSEWPTPAMLIPSTGAMVPALP